MDAYGLMLAERQMVGRMKAKGPGNIAAMWTHEGQRPMQICNYDRTLEGQRPKQHCNDVDA
jgi:hypothetical protein